MITLRKHDHCKVCGKPIPKGYKAEVIGMLADLRNRLIRTPGDMFYSTYTLAYQGHCHDCAQLEVIHEVVDAVEAKMRDTYLRGYDHRAESALGMVRMVGNKHFRPAMVCPLCDIYLDADNICPQCNREYEPHG